MSTIDWVLSTLSIIVIIGMAAAMIGVTIAFHPKKTEPYVEYGPTSTPLPTLDAPQPQQEHVSYALGDAKPRRRVQPRLANMDVQTNERRRRDLERRAAYPWQT